MPCYVSRRGPSSLARDGSRSPPPHCSLVRGACAGTASRSSGGSAWRVTSARAASGTSRSSSKEEEEEEEDAMHTTRRRRSSPSSALRTRLTCARASGRGISAHASLSCDGRDEGEMAEERASSGRRERAGGTTDGVEREEEDDGGARTNGWTDGRTARAHQERARALVHPRRPHVRELEHRRRRRGDVRRFPERDVRHARRGGAARH